MKVLIHNDMELWDFINDGLRSREDFIDIPLNRYRNLFQKACGKYLYSQRLPVVMVLGSKLREILRSLRRGDEVILSAYTQPCIFRAVQQCVSDGVRVCLWMWNPIKGNLRFINNIQILQKEGFSCYTFDKEDSISMNMYLLDTFYNMHPILPLSDVSKVINDFYFLGAVKDRMQTVNLLKKSLSNYKTLFITPSMPSEFITYAQNIYNILQSRCIIDIVQNQQHDITLRPLEAIAYKRKLLTNNKFIKDYPFYDPNNIFIWGEDDPQNLGVFLNTPFVDIDPQCVIRYDVNSWFDKI